MKLNYTHTLYASYNGYITQAVINIFPPLIFIVFQKYFGISLTQIGLLSSFNFAVQMIIDFLAIKFILNVLSDPVRCQPSGERAQDFK